MINFRNKTSGFVFVLLLILLSFGIYYFSKETNIAVEDKVIKKDLRKCFLLKDENRKRVIIYENKEINGKKMIKGVDTFSNLKTNTKESFDFIANIKDGYMNAFGQNKDGVMEERIYKVFTNGLIEGLIDAKSGRKKVENDGIIYSLISDRSAVKYDGKYAILKINCKKITE